MREHDTHDVSEIQAVIEQLFSAISWNPGKAPDWETFRSLCLDDALLVPAARPARPTALAPFIQRMDEQRNGGQLSDFQERVLAHDVGVFGNVAVARSSFATSINQGTEARGVNAFMLIKDGGSWRIAAMSWDNESEDHPVPADFT
jgi:ketosteroid isomerase-like protein